MKVKVMFGRERLILEVFFTFFFLVWLANELGAQFVELLILQPFPHYFFPLTVVFFDMFFFLEWLLRTLFTASRQHKLHYHTREGGVLDLASSLIPLMLHSIPMLIAWAASRVVFLSALWTIILNMVAVLRYARFFKVLRLGNYTAQAVSIFLPFLLLAGIGNYFIVNIMQEFSHHAGESVHISADITPEDIIATQDLDTQKIQFQSELQPPLMLSSYLYTRKMVASQQLFLHSPYASMYERSLALYRSILIGLLSILILFLFSRNTHKGKSKQE